MKRFIYVLTAIVLMMSNVAAFGTSIEEKTEQNQLIEDMILYYGCYGEAADEEINWLLGALKKNRYSSGKTLGGDHGLLGICQYRPGDQ